MSSLAPSVVTLWSNDAGLKTVPSLWLDHAKPDQALPYAVFTIRPGTSVPSFGGDQENQYNVEFSVFTESDAQAQQFLDYMDARFHFQKFAMAAPEQCMASLHKRPGEVTQVGLGRDNKPIFRARCVYLVRVFIPAP